MSVGLFHLTGSQPDTGSGAVLIIPTTGKWVLLRMECVSGVVGMGGSWTLQLQDPSIIGLPGSEWLLCFCAKRKSNSHTVCICTREALWCPPSLWQFPARWTMGYFRLGLKMNFALQWQHNQKHWCCPAAGPGRQQDMSRNFSVAF